MKTRRPQPALRLSLLAALGFADAGCDDEPINPDAGSPEAGLDARTPDEGPPPDGATPDGATPDGATPDGATPDGATPDGATPDGAVPSNCDNPQPILDPQGVPTGVQRCADGSKNRVEAVACDPIVDLTPCSGEPNDGSCQQDTDCGGSPHGRCVIVPQGGGFEFCSCRYGCASDSDCSEGQVCICPGVIDGSSYCAPADCTTGADCDSGECGVNATSDGCNNYPQVACREPDVDNCRTNQGCQEDGAGDGCQLSNDGNWMCTFLPICGRPLTIDGAARTAPPTGRDDWMAGIAAYGTDGTLRTPRMTSLSAAERFALAEWWSGIAALEHASVASFARTTLQLLALGAPADLIADTQRAAVDEVEHARLAYRLAAAYAGRPIGPDTLPIGDLSLTADRRAVITALIDEGCVGETLGAAEAAAIADAADPAVAAVGATLVADETRHAALAWRTLRWLLDGADDGTDGTDAIDATNTTTAMARDAFAAAIDRARRAEHGTGPHLPAHGLPGPTARRTLHHDAINEVIVPCARALGLMA